MQKSDISFEINDSKFNYRVAIIFEHNSMHSLQINTFGPTINSRTSFWDFPQKEQHKDVSEELAIFNLSSKVYIKNQN